jgi:hypothetical protein
MFFDNCILWETICAEYVTGRDVFMALRPKILRLRYKGHTMDALASVGDEGRDKLR